MTENKTHVTFVLDSSGSMSRIEDDTKGGFNIFLRDQKEEEGEATVSLYEFNTNVELVHLAIDIEDAPELDDENYSPGGRTALHDAITRAVGETEDHIETLPEKDQPENVVVVVLTDGKENASETPQDTVRERVEEKREEGWEFLFVGANQDAALTAESVGMDANKSLDMDHSGEGSKEAQRATSRRVSEVREQGSTEGYTQEDRQAQEDAGDRR
jgi:Mg-chelatase subunit ChlD